jgi:glutamate/aspartate transport system substrate-binding protein
MKKMFVVLALCIGVSSFAQTSTIQKIKDTGKIVVGVRTNADPFSSFSEGKASGYVVDLCNSVTQDIQKMVGKKLDVQYVPVTPSNRFEKIASSEIDMECGTTTVNAARRQKAEFSYNTFITSTNFVTLQKNKLNSYRDFYEPLVMNNQKMAIMKGTSHEDMVNKWGRGDKISFIYVTSVEEGMKKVKSGEAFGFIQDKVLIEKALNNLQLDKKDFAFSQDSLSLEPYSIMVKKGDTEMLRAVNNSLYGIYSSGEAKKTLASWLGKSNIDMNYLTNDTLKKPSTENAVP